MVNGKIAKTILKALSSSNESSVPLSSFDSFLTSLDEQTRPFQNPPKCSLYDDATVTEYPDSVTVALKNLGCKEESSETSDKEEEATSPEATYPSEAAFPAEARRKTITYGKRLSVTYEVYIFFTHFPKPCLSSSYTFVICLQRCIFSVSNIVFFCFFSNR